MRSRVFSANEKTELMPFHQSEAARHHTLGCCWVYLHHPGSNYLYTLHTPHSSQLWLTYKATINMSRPEPSLATEYTTKRAHNWTSIILLLCKLKTLRNIALAIAWIMAHDTLVSSLFPSNEALKGGCGVWGLIGVWLACWQQSAARSLYPGVYCLGYKRVKPN